MNIRRIIAGISAVCVIGAVMPSVSVISDNAVITANAEGETADYTEGKYEQLTYRNYSDHIEISACDQTATEVVIPAEIDGLPVTSIGSMSFDFCTSLKSVTISNSVTNIGYHAFTGCTGLTEITMPNGLTSIGEGAFLGCTGLTSITIPNSVTDIGISAFDGCNALASIIIPDSVTSIGFCAFSSTSWLREKQKENPLVIVNNILIDGKTCSGDVIIPDNIKIIAEGAFYICSGLTSVTILNSNCKIFDTSDTISDTATIYGYDNSTAQAYAEKYDKIFESIGAAPAKELTMGDIDGDGEINASDASFILAEYSKISTSGAGDFTEDMKNAADINKDGLIDSVDSSLILSYYSYTSTGGTDTIDKFLESKK